MDDLGFNEFASPIMTEEDHRRDAERYTTAAEKFGGSDKVVVGKVVRKRADFSSNRFYVAIDTRVYTDEMRGLQRCEGFISLNSIAETASVYRTVEYCDAFAVIDRATSGIVALLDLM